ncbi:MAG: hypothetical protein HRU43_04615 [Simkaniaceae bacterium]|nr:hypothetical protein [Simkaniaceae bacterium]
MSKRFFTLFLLVYSCFYGSLTSLIEITKSEPQGWIQKGDRWNFKEINEDRRSEILPILDEMGMFKTVWAKDAHYNYAIVLGSLQSSVETRIGHLIDEWNRGVRFDEVILLTGQRPLHPEKEKSVLHLKTETAMMLHVWNEAQMPEGLRSTPLTVVDAPPYLERGRPTTESTVYAWLEMSPKPGSILMVSSQPYVGYQNAIFDVLLQNFDIQAVGREGGRSLPISVLFDTLGKIENWKERLK